jgi:hypothetical protein
MPASPGIPSSTAHLRTKGRRRRHGYMLRVGAPLNASIFVNAFRCSAQFLRGIGPLCRAARSRGPPQQERATLRCPVPSHRRSNRASVFRVVAALRPFGFTHARPRRTNSTPSTAPLAKLGRPGGFPVCSSAAREASFASLTTITRPQAEARCARNSCRSY